MDDHRQGRHPGQAPTGPRRFEPRRGHQQHAEVAKRARHEQERFQRGWVRGVDVVQDHQPGPAQRRGQQHGPQGIQAPEARQLGIARRLRGRRRIPERSQVPAQRLVGLGKLGPEGAQHLDPRPACRRAAAVPGGAPGHAQPADAGVVGESLHQRGLADPRLAGDEDQASTPRLEIAEPLAKDGQLPLAADQRLHPAGWAGPGGNGFHASALAARPASCSRRIRTSSRRSTDPLNPRSRRFRWRRR